MQNVCNLTVSSRATPSFLSTQVPPPMTAKRKLDFDEIHIDQCLQKIRKITGDTTITK